ncbi:antibiotic biosynthesis monooxygenase [Streptomyces marincola]|uniref:Antibiotic biosynthesis monooxygenase n=1 Tax=Streptomyces marincola TaxID=2878388 RepID=A0A1W7D2I0_9ACTN|nr:antibiotic biosynthesis monooxygenase [Streptomyces marincola]ARQ71271.1 antibiotic biosynthesis monooxygenase [Streptomyces marincola]
MSVRIGTLPTPTRSDARVVLAATWRVGTPERQRATVEAIVRTWRSRPWPDEGLVAYSVLTGTDGDTLLHYAQWRDLAAYESYVVHHADERAAEIDAAVPGIERGGPRAYELYRSTSAANEVRTPGCVVIVDVTFEGHDPRRQRDWVDAVFEALGSDPAPHPGGISAHFHTGLDGSRVLNFAEWESERAHAEALDAAGEGVGSPTEQWRRVQTFPGLSGSRVTRYLPAISIEAA